MDTKYNRARYKSWVFGVNNVNEIYTAFTDISRNKIKQPISLLRMLYKCYSLHKMEVLSRTQRGKGVSR